MSDSEEYKRLLELNEHQRKMIVELKNEIEDLQKELEKLKKELD